MKEWGPEEAPRDQGIVMSLTNSRIKCSCLEDGEALRGFREDAQAVYFFSLALKQG